MAIQILDLVEPEELTADEAAAVFGGRRSVTIRDQKLVNKLKKRAMRKVQRIATRKNIIRQARLGNGSKIVKYKALATSTKTVASNNNNASQANKFRI